MKKFKFPNIRKVFKADPGHLIVDADLKGADAQVVAAEAEDEELLEAFRLGLDVHTKNAEDLFGIQFLNALPERKIYLRKKVKAGVHGTNYGGSAYALAQTLGWTVHEADKFQKRWFGLHPGILKWQKRISATLKAPTLRKRAIWNKFGNRKYFTDRYEENYKQALAWVPQSTVAQLTFKAARAVKENCGEFISSDIRYYNGFLGQVHDSLILQIQLKHQNSLPVVLEHLNIPIPYDPPLLIPWGVKISKTSWGELTPFKLAA